MNLPNFIEAGAGDTAIFFLHGVGGGAQAWAQNLPVLAAQGYRCIAWDMPGYGDSSAITPYNNQTLAQSLLSLIAHISAKSNILLGHSMGGMVAQEAFALQPGTIQGLILFATSPAFGKPGGDWQQQFLASRFAPLDAGLGMAGLAPDLVRGMFAPRSTDSPIADRQDAAMLAAVALMSRVPEATYRAALTAISSFNRLDNLTNINVPTLCLAAEFDKNAAPAVMEKMAARIANAQYQCLPGAGHLANMEDPQAFNAAVLNFLQNHFSH